MKNWKVILAVLGLSAASSLVSAAGNPTPAIAPAATTGNGPSQAQLEQQLQDARKQLQDAAHRVADLSMQLDAPMMQMRFDHMQHRAILGVNLEDDDEGNGSGASIASITPDGPADKAGLKADDVITAINGDAVKSDNERNASDKLVKFMDGVKPGDKLKVAYTRDGKAATTVLTAGDMGDGLRMRMVGSERRAILGVDVDDDDQTGGSGVSLSGVSPDGPADKAGLRSGDVITGINGTIFKPEGDRSADHAFMKFMKGVKPGDSLKVAYTRDGKSNTANLTASSASDYSYSMTMPPIPPMPPMAPMPPMPPMHGFNMYFGTGGPLGDMQLVSMSPGLSQYFGTDKGLLVLRVPKDSTLQLQDGDVILQVGGRDPGSPPHAMRILSSYGPGESVKIDIMRKGKPVILNVTVPKSKEDSSSDAFNFSGGGAVIDNDDDDDDGGAEGR